MQSKNAADPWTLCLWYCLNESNNMCLLALPATYAKVYSNRAFQQNAAVWVIALLSLEKQAVKSSAQISLEHWVCCLCPFSSNSRPPSALISFFGSDPFSQQQVGAIPLKGYSEISALWQGLCPMFKMKGVGTNCSGARTLALLLHTFMNSPRIQSSAYLDGGLTPFLSCWFQLSKRTSWFPYSHSLLSLSVVHPGFLYSQPGYTPIALTVGWFFYFVSFGFWKATAIFLTGCPFFPSAVLSLAPDRGCISGEERSFRDLILIPKWNYL